MLILILFLTSVFFAQAQTDSILNKSVQSKPVMKKDTLKFSNFQMSKSPMGAVVRSLIFPGWGQIYVKSYWKAPIFTGACAVLGYFVYDWNKKYTAKAELVDQLSKINPNDINLLYEKRYREFYRDNRDQSAFYLAAVYLIAAIDSYSDAHLFDFNVDDKLSINFAPGKFGGAFITLNLKLF